MLENFYCQICEIFKKGSSYNARPFLPGRVCTNCYLYYILPRHIRSFLKTDNKENIYI